MKLIPESLSRKVAGQALLARKHSPTILFGTGLVSMVGSTVLACRATLKVEEVLTTIENEKIRMADVKELVDSGQGPEGTTYTDAEYAHDLRLHLVQGGFKLVKLYAPSVILGGFGIVCLTKSHRILEERNVALTAAYVAVENAFSRYRERVVDRFGEDTDRELRYDYEEVDIIDEETGKVTAVTRAGDLHPGMYARWFDSESTTNFNAPPFEEYNWMFLRQQQNWCNDLLRAKGHLFLNDVYKCLGLEETKAGQIVGWVYKLHNETGDNFVDFGCWDQQQNPLSFMNGREGSILLDFNVDGNIWELLGD